MIKNIGEFQQTLGTYDARGWSKKVGNELGESLNLRESSNVGGVDQKTFGDFLKESVGQVNEMQQEANVAMQKLASGESKDLHETLLTVEKAEIAFKTMGQIRNKVIDTYREMMRMQI
jgi:flagellar hook-basal body complex protein FliE